MKALNMDIGTARIWEKRGGLPEIELDQFLLEKERGFSLAALNAI